MNNQQDSQEDTPDIESAQGQPVPEYDNNINFLDSVVGTESFKPPRYDGKLLNE
ncbi:hypothetical protein [Morganella psychrotolerans]|uniref:hypothetical protein n=1 Tax=Morganella psychrotolerans TaxID=368603 RepID=UPI0039AF9212